MGFITNVQVKYMIRIAQKMEVVNENIYCKDVSFYMKCVSGVWEGTEVMVILRFLLQILEQLWKNL